MRRGILTILALLLLAAPLAAGQCEHEAQECLDYLMTMRDRGFAGVDLDSEAAEGWVITKVHPDSPAASGGVRVGDILLKIEDVPLGDQEAMKKLDEIMKPGNSVGFTVRRQGREKTLRLELTRMPDEVFARFVGEHMLQHATVDVAASD